jgi:hypothetical protein
MINLWLDFALRLVPSDMAEDERSEVTSVIGHKIKEGEQTRYERWLRMPPSAII